MRGPRELGYVENENVTVERRQYEDNIPRLREFAAELVSLKAGGLMSYGPDIADLYRRCGLYVARVLKGARVGERPIERPARFLLTINRQAARSLRLTIPPSLLVRADQLID